MKKRHVRQFIAMLLVLCMVCTDLPYTMLSARAAETQEENDTASGILEEDGESDTAESFDETEETGIVVEEENTENSTTFDLGGGKRKTVFFSNRVRFEDENGKLKDYDPSLTTITEEESEHGEYLEGYAYENESGDTKQYLPETISGDTPILMENGAYSIRFHPVFADSCTSGAEDAEKVPEYQKTQISRRMWRQMKAQMIQ